MIIRTAFLCLFAPVSAFAVTLDMPSNANLTVEDVTAIGSYAMPTAPWTPDGLAVLTANGEVRQQAWRIESPGLTTAQLLGPLQKQLDADGFTTLFSCSDDACGGFDFRFATDVLPAPDMHVDLGDYRFLATQRGEGDDIELVSLLASRSSTAGFIQVIRVGPPGGSPVAAPQAPAVQAVSAAPTTVLSTDTRTGAGTGELVQELETTGRFIMSDLTFQTGSAQLGDTTFPSLQKLADYLIANPDRTVALVGHTDSVGSLAPNIALSKRRAGSVLERLVSAFDIPRRQLEAEGVGYLTPIATNLTPEGRDQNRRVEVIITSTE